MERLRALRFVRSLAIGTMGTTAALADPPAQRPPTPPVADAGATACPRELPLDGVRCEAPQQTCRYGRGPQLITCQCEARSSGSVWICPNREAPRLPPGVAAGPQNPPELLETCSV